MSGYSGLRLEFDEVDYWPGYEMNLKCPGCREANGNHIDDVKAQVRYDDEPIKKFKLHLTSGDLSMESTTETEGPSRRRHSVTLQLWCEFCGRVYDITFAQHKGATLVSIEQVWA